MRSTYIAIALCVGFAVPVAIGSPAYAYQASTAFVSEDIQAQIDAVILNDNLTDEEVQEQIAALVQGSADPVAAANLVLASVARAPAARRVALGAGLAQAANALEASQPEIASAIQTVVATEAPADVQVSYAVTATQLSSLPANNNTPVALPTVPDNVPTIPSLDELGIIPTVPEPNPAQAGSPV